VKALDLAARLVEMARTDPDIIVKVGTSKEGVVSVELSTSLMRPGVTEKIALIETTDEAEREDDDLMSQVESIQDDLDHLRRQVEARKR
jgi:hypothetical protein